MPSGIYIPENINMVFKIKYRTTAIFERTDTYSFIQHYNKIKPASG